MNRSSSSTMNPVSVATTAGALVALLAVAAIVGSLPGGGSSIRVALLETRVGANETDAVRAVAAAMTAAARELVGGERMTAATPTVIAVVGDDLPAASVSRWTPALLDRWRMLHVRLIDMPPPGC